MRLEDIPPPQTLEEFEREAGALLKPPYKSRFGAVLWRNTPSAEEEYTDLVEGMIPEGGIAMLAGASQSGKTFAALDLAMAIATGRKWFDRSVEAGGVVYFAAEDPKGVRSLRIPAYAKANGLTFDQDIPFALLTERLNIWEAPERAEELAKEAIWIAGHWNVPLKLIVIDTLAKASIGSDELSAKEMNIIMDRCERIGRATGATILLVDHLNANGARVRGVGSKTANIDAVLICRLATLPGQRKGETVQATDHDNRKLREITNDIEAGGKVKNGAPLERPFRFVLPRVDLGVNAKGKPLDSCVLAPPAGEDIEKREAATGRVRLDVKLSVAMRSLAAAVDEFGRNAPAHVPNAPAGKCVTLSDWVHKLAPILSREGEEEAKLRERVGDHLRKSVILPLTERNYLVKHGDWVWRTGRKVPGLDYIAPTTVPAEAREPAPLHPELQGDDIQL